MGLEMDQSGVAEQNAADDAEPSNVDQIDVELQNPRMGRMQQEALMNERERLIQQQTQYVRQQVQQFPARLQQEFSLGARTGLPPDPNQQYMQLRKIIDARRARNPNPGGGPYPADFSGVRG